MDEMCQRLTPMLVAVRQHILASSMSDDEKGDLLESLGGCLDAAMGKGLDSEKLDSNVG